MGGITASHNKGGAYLRNRVIPVNPGTAEQLRVRQALGDLAARWTNTLTQPERDAWDVYALNVPLLNPLGESRSVTGLNMYQRSNVQRLQVGLPRVDAAPTLFNLGDFTLPTIASLTAPTAYSINFTDTDAWVGEDDAAMLFYGSRNTGFAIQFFKGPYRRFAIQLLGNLALPPTSPFAGVSPFLITAGNKGFIRFSVTRADGRLSQTSRAVAIAV